tara:strand:- start:1901 stop:2323 length:423 start_codon:yes stop_codon:yes gene_type:complete
MIKYLLICKNCSLEFESWFASSKEFDKLKKLRLLNCQSCKSQKIEKSLMKPNLANASFKKDKISNNNKIIKKKLKEYQKFIKRNFEYVGENFAYEARSIHYNKNKDKKNIYGKASKEDVKELKEEGIDTTTIPWIEDKEN